MRGSAAAVPLVWSGLADLASCAEALCNVLLGRRRRTNTTTSYKCPTIVEVAPHLWFAPWITGGTRFQLGRGFALGASNEAGCLRRLRGGYASALMQGIWAHGLIIRVITLAGAGRRSVKLWSRDSVT